MTYPAKINTSTGHIHIEEKEIDEDMIGTDNQQTPTKSTSATTFSKDEKEYLNEIFYVLSK